MTQGHGVTHSGLGFREVDLIADPDLPALEEAPKPLLDLGKKILEPGCLHTAELGGGGTSNLGDMGVTSPHTHTPPHLGDVPHGAGGKTRGSRWHFGHLLTVVRTLSQESSTMGCCCSRKTKPRHKLTACGEAEGGTRMR